MPIIKSALAILVMVASVNASLYEMMITGVASYGNYMEDYGVKLGDEFRAQVVYNDHPAFDWQPSPNHGEYPLRSAVASVGSTIAKPIDDLFPSEIEIIQMPGSGLVRLKINFLPIVDDGMFRDWLSVWIELQTLPGIELANDRPPSVVDVGIWDYSASSFGFEETWIDGYEGLDLQFAYGHVTAVEIRPVPEPTTAVILVLGVALAWKRKWRRRRLFAP